jgi:hypothetical protein
VEQVGGRLQQNDHSSESIAERKGSLRVVAYVQLVQSLYSSSNRPKLKGQLCCFCLATQMNSIKKAFWFHPMNKTLVNVCVILAASNLSR